jgi:5-hydroxyisourate hydrolase-like protein (transthyretin family)
MWLGLVGAVSLVAFATWSGCGPSPTKCQNGPCSPTSTTTTASTSGSSGTSASTSSTSTGSSTGSSGSTSTSGQVDNQPPQLVSATVTPSQVDTSASAQTVTLSLHITDDLSGFADGTTFSLEFTSASGAHQLSSTYDSSTRSDGTAQDGTYAVSINVPRYSEQGVWTLSTLEMGDAAGNRRTYTAAELNRVGLAATFTETGQSADTQPPVLVSTSIAPSQVDTTSQDQSVTLTMHITDDLSGFADGVPTTTVLTSASGQHHLYSGLSSSARVSGDANDGVYQLNFTVHRYTESGTWSLTEVSFQDGAGNSANYTTAQLSDGGLAASFQQTGTVSDSQPPQLVDASAMPAQVDVSSSAQTVTLTMHITDDLSGFADDLLTSVVFESPTQHQSALSNLSATNRTSGTALDGTYQVAFQVPQFAETGVWTLSQLSFEDEVGNHTAFDANALATAGHTVTFTVQ